MICLLAEAAAGTARRDSPRYRDACDRLDGAWVDVYPTIASAAAELVRLLAAENNDVLTDAQIDWLVDRVVHIHPTLDRATTASVLRAALDGPGAIPNVTVADWCRHAVAVIGEITHTWDDEDRARFLFASAA